MRPTFVLLIALSGLWAQPAGDKAVSLPRKFVIGETWEYRSTVTMAQTGKAPVNNTIVHRAKIVSVNSKGAATIEKSMVSGTGANSRFVVPKTGAVDLKQFASGSGRSYNDDPFATSLLPNKPVKPGDGWSTELVNGGTKVRFICQYVGAKTVNGARVHHIAYSAAPADGPPTMSMKGFYYLDAATGWLTQIAFDMTATNGREKLTLKGSSIGKRIKG